MMANTATIESFFPIPARCLAKAGPERASSKIGPGINALAMAT
jgi:hypothetical protein